MSYFNFQAMLDKHKIPFWEKSCCVAIVGERNTGKTTNPLETFMEKASENYKVVICRNTDKQLKTAVSDFNVRFNKRFQIYGGLIWKLEKTIIENKKGEENEEYKRSECVGYVADLNNYHNYKSVQAKDVRMIFFDEFIQMDNISDFYQKLVNLFMTFVRFNQTSILLIANRDAANNELMVNWDIPPQKQAPKEDLVYNVRDNIWFVDLGTEQFKDLYKTDQPHIIKSLAALNEETNTYINEGGFIHDFSLSVMNYNRYIKQTFNPFYLINYKERKAAIGSFDDDKLAICISKGAIEKAEAEGLQVIPIDSTGYLIEESVLIDLEYSSKILKQLLHQYKKHNLYFDSFEVLEWIKRKMSIAL